MRAPKFMLKLGMVDYCFTNLTIIPKLPPSNARCLTVKVPVQPGTTEAQVLAPVVKVIPKIYILGVSDGVWLDVGLMLV